MSESENSQDFICGNGETVTIKVKDDGYAAHVIGSDGLEIGRLEFVEYDDNSLLLVWAHLEGGDHRYVRQGIGRECVRVMKEYYGMPIVARANDGVVRDDGSHLTGNAPAFVEALRKEGMISYLGDYRGNEEIEPY